MATSFIQQSHVAVAVLSISAIAFSAGELWQAFRLRRGAAHASVLGEVLFRLLCFGAILLLPFGASVAPRAEVPGGVAAFVLGATVGWMGLLLRWWSFVALGRYFTVVVRTSSAQKVVERGPYRILRHPSYTGLLMALLGCGVMLGNWAGALASSAVLLAAVVYRIRIEERALIANPVTPTGRSRKTEPGSCRSFGSHLASTASPPRHGVHGGSPSHRAGRETAHTVGAFCR